MYSAAQIKRFLMDDIEEMASHPELVCSCPGKDFTKPKKLPLRDVLLIPLYMHQDSTTSELLTYFDNDADRTPSFSAWAQQRSKLRIDAFRQLLQKFNSHFTPTLYNGEAVLTAVDGTTLNMFYDPHSPLTFVKPNGASPGGHNEIHAIASLRVSDGMYSDLVLQPGSQIDERAAFCEMIDRDRTAAGKLLYLADRGFQSYNVYAHCIKNGAWFLIRATELYVNQLLRDDLPQTEEFDMEVDRILVRHKAKKAYSRPESPELYRYIEKDTSFDYLDHGSKEEFGIHLRVVRVRIDNDSYEYLITNLPDDKYPLEQLRILYWLRWKIEVSICHLKKVVGAEAFHTRSLVNVTHELLARLVKYNFCSAIASIARKNIEGKKGKKHPHQINFSLAIKKCHDFLLQKESETPINIVRIIEKYTLPVRDDRKFPRDKNTEKPMTFLYRH